MPLWLNEQDVRALLPMAELIDLMQTALAAFSAGQVNQPVRTVLEVGQGHAFFASMPAFASTIPALGAKLVTVFGENIAKGLPSHLATILLLDAGTGALQAVMDGRFITEARTAAVSGVAVRHLAHEQTPVLAIIGSGVQARSHLEALPHVREFREIRCWSPNLAHSAALPHMHVANSAEEAVTGADVVVLATSSPTPVIDAAWVKPGACVVSVGACRPNQREMDPALVARARLIVDSRAAALRESGDVLLGIEEGRFTADHIAAELGQVVSDPALGRTAFDQVVIFKSLGLAVEDLAAAHLAYQRALESKRGLPLA
jgi:alanine dehydrogenase